MKLFHWVVLMVVFGVLLYASAGLPQRGDPGAPAHREYTSAGTPVASSYYIRNAYRDARTPNIVTVVLADYRGFDTLGEVVVVLTAGLCCVLLLRRSKA